MMAKKYSQLKCKSVLPYRKFILAATLSLERKEVYIYKEK